MHLCVCLIQSEHEGNSHDNDDISREMTNVEVRGAALPLPPNPESRQELYIRNGKYVS